MAGSCAETDLDSIIGRTDADGINVGGIETDDMQIASRATSQNAETIEWLKQPLQNGLDITYGFIEPNGTHSHQDVAILKLDPGDNPTTYTFKYRADRTGVDGVDGVGAFNDAIWYNNGQHYFQGVHVPERIRYNGTSGSIEDVEKPGKAPGLMTDQYDATATGTDDKLGNYTLLAHYLGMPADCRITATIERIKLPFRHRLARVVAFVLIDPELNTKLKGYKKDAAGNTVTDEDPRTTSFRFNYVKVLKGVKDVITDGHSTLTPIWGTARKVIPHFDGERGSYSYKDNRSLADDFILYTKTDADGNVTNVYPTTTSPAWSSIHAATPDASGKKLGYTAVNYGKVPVYDIIVRPTYTDENNVMYDEDLEGKTKADFAKYDNSIDFEVALENGLNYEKTFNFDLNANYQTVVYLRISREHVDYNDAGSELWVETKKTDHWYGVDNDNGNTLSMAGSSWQRAYRSCSVTDDYVTDGDLYNNGENVGQYLGSTSKWTELLAQAYKGGEHHGDYFILDEDIEIDTRFLPADFVFTGHLDARDHIITLIGTGSDTYDVTDDYSDEASLYYTTTSGTTPAKFVMPQLYICEEVAQAKSGRALGTIPSGPEMMTPVSPTLAEIMANTIVYYEKVGSSYREWNPRLWTYYTKRTSASSLFCGIDGEYTTSQEEAADPYAPGVVWEANVHKETNKSERWVPTPGYRAEVLNTIVKGGTLFPTGVSLHGNVQNSFNMNGAGTKSAVTNTPNIPQYK